MADEKAVVIYPRGFIGFDIGLVKDNPNVNDFLQKVRDIEFNRPLEKNNNVYPSNPAVDALWKEYTSGAGNANTFEFRERILQAALGAFGTQSFYDWCVLQTNNPYLSPLHKQFLNSTFGFLTSGSRSISIGTWQSLVSLRDGTQAAAGIEDLDINAFFRLDESNDNQRVGLLIDTVNEWVKHDSGFLDLLGTLVVLFGEIN